MPTTSYTSVSAILTLQCAKCGFYQKTTNPAIASLLAAKHQAGWGSAHVVTTTGASFLDFTTGTLPPGVTFTRASTGTYNNSSNILATAGVNVARFNYVAGVACLLIEPAATNLVLQSNNFATSWNAVGSPVRTAAQFISPDGANNGWTVSGDTAFGYAGLAQSPALSTSTAYIFSSWIKQITGGNVTFDINGATGPAMVPTAILSRLSVAVTTTATVNYFEFLTFGNSGQVNGFYGAQLELGSKVTSYIPTTTAAATRAIDQATFTIPAGVTQLKYTFDDNSTQTVSVSPGSYTIPANLNRANIKTIDTISGSASLNFDFTTGVLPGAITFTRPSIGTYVNNAGTLITAGNNVARLNYIGGVANLLIEGSATNLLFPSNGFSTAPWTVFSGGVVTPAQFISPDGTNNGWSYADLNNFEWLQYPPITFSNIPYALSLWAKQITGTAPIQFSIGAVNANRSPSSTITRLLLTGTPNNLDTYASFRMMTSNGSVNGIYGAQVETGSVMTSYIPTTTTSVTRSADSATFTIPSGVGHLTYTFDDNSTQTVVVSAGSYTVPTTLNRPNIKSIVGSA